MGLMDGKRGLVVGVANEHSYAFFITESLLREGGQCLFTHLPGQKMERRVRKALSRVGQADPWLQSMDARSDLDLIAFADKDWLRDGVFAKTPREAFLQALDISAYTYMAMANRAAALMPHGGAMLAMSYYGAEKAVPGYNVMGVAKAALESATRYLAAEMGPKNIRVNAISGGPLRTMSALAVGGFSQILEWVEQKAPLRRNVTGSDVGDAAAYLLSDHAAGVTGQILHVDCGYSAVGI
ncbi:MAG: enoyl-ACP reductase FabI [Planctomycetota bacterium]|jgi:enoyl-[acyl-carrier protein] reductase I